MNLWRESELRGYLWMNSLLMWKGGKVHWNFHGWILFQNLYQAYAHSREGRGDYLHLHTHSEKGALSRGKLNGYRGRMVCHLMIGQRLGELSGCDWLMEANDYGLRKKGLEGSVESSWNVPPADQNVKGSEDEVVTNETVHVSENESLSESESGSESEMVSGIVHAGNERVTCERVNVSDHVEVCENGDAYENPVNVKVGN